MALRRDLVLTQRQRFAECDPQLPLHEIETGDHLGDGMLDLQARVHFDEIKPAPVGDELDGAGADIAGRLGGGPRRSRHLGASLGRDAERQCLLHHLLVAALQRAFALEQRHHVAVGVAEHLHFDVPGPGDVSLDQDLVAAECRTRFALGACDCFSEFIGVADDPHPPPSAAGRRLDQHRIAHAHRRPTAVFARL